MAELLFYQLKMSTELQVRAKWFQADVIDPTLEELGLYSLSASRLLLGTAIQESGLRYRKQLGGGPARGYLQMEPATYTDIWTNYLSYRPDLANKVAVFKDSHSDMWQMAYNDRLCVCMSRIHYLRVPAPLPDAHDIEGMAQYWDKYYNCNPNIGTVSEYITNWAKLLEA